MKTWQWLLLILLLVGLAAAIGYYLSTLKKVVSNRDKISAGLDLASNLETILS